MYAVHDRCMGLLRLFQLPSSNAIFFGNLRLQYLLRESVHEVFGDGKKGKPVNMLHNVWTRSSDLDICWFFKCGPVPSDQISPGLSLLAVNRCGVQMLLGNEFWSVFPAVEGMWCCRTDNERKKREEYSKTTRFVVRYSKLFYIGFVRYSIDHSAISCRHLSRSLWKNVGFSGSSAWSFAKRRHHSSCDLGRRVSK